MEKPRRPRRSFNFHRIKFRDETSCARAWDMRPLFNYLTRLQRAGISAFSSAVGQLLLSCAVISLHTIFIFRLSVYLHACVIPPNENNPLPAPAAVSSCGPRTRLAVSYRQTLFVPHFLKLEKKNYYHFKLKISIYARS